MRNEIRQITKISLCLLIGIAFSCKRYPDGPFFSFRSAEGRLLYEETTSASWEGKWKLELVNVDGEDKMFLLDTLPFKISYYRFSRYNKSIGDIRRGIGIMDSNDEWWGGGEWSWGKKKQHFIIDGSGSYYKAPIPALLDSVNRIEEWEILKLTKERFWLWLEYQGKVYETHFIRYEAS